MANIALFDPNSSPVANQVTEYLRSADTNQYLSVSDKLVNPDTGVVAGQPIRYWKVVNGELDIMTALERDAVDDAEEALQLQFDRDAAKDFYDISIGERALALAMLDIVNKLLLGVLTALNNHWTVGAAAGHNRPAVTIETLKASIIAQSGDVFTAEEMRDFLRAKVDELS